MGLRLAPIPTVEPTACLCNAWFHGSFWATVGRAVSARLEEVTALVGAVAGEDSETFSRGGKSASIAPIVGRGSWPSIMF